MIRYALAFIWCIAMPCTMYANRYTWPGWAFEAFFWGSVALLALVGIIEIHFECRQLQKNLR